MLNDVDIFVIVNYHVLENIYDELLFEWKESEFYNKNETVIVLIKRTTGE